MQIRLKNNGIYQQIFYIFNVFSLNSKFCVKHTSDILKFNSRFDSKNNPMFFFSNNFIFKHSLLHIIVHSYTLAKKCGTGKTAVFHGRKASLS